MQRDEWVGDGGKKWPPAFDKRRDLAYSMDAWRQNLGSRAKIAPSKKLREETVLRKLGALVWHTKLMYRYIWGGARLEYCSLS